MTSPTPGSALDGACTCPRCLHVALPASTGAVLSSLSWSLVSCFMHPVPFSRSFRCPPLHASTRSSGFRLHRNGRAWWASWCAMHPSIAVMHSSSGSKTASFSLCPDSLGKNPSTASVRDAGVGVKRNVRSGRPFGHVRTSAAPCDETVSGMTCTGVPGAIPSATGSGKARNSCERWRRRGPRAGRSCRLQSCVLVPAWPGVTGRGFRVRREDDGMVGRVDAEADDIAGHPEGPDPVRPEAVLLQDAVQTIPGLPTGAGPSASTRRSVEWSRSARSPNPAPGRCGPARRASGGSAGCARCVRGARGPRPEARSPAVSISGPSVCPPPVMRRVMAAAGGCRDPGKIESPVSD